MTASHKLRLLALLLVCSLAAFFLRGAVSFTDPDYEELYYAQLARAESWKAQQHRTFLAYRFQRRAHHRWKRVVLRSPSVQEAFTIGSIVYGVPRSALSAVGWCESRHDPNARLGRYRGVMQEGPMFESGPFGRAGLSVWSPIANVLTAAYTVSREGWSQWECAKVLR